MAELKMSINEVYWTLMIKWEWFETDEVSAKKKKKIMPIQSNVTQKVNDMLPNFVKVI